MTAVRSDGLRGWTTRLDATCVLTLIPVAAPVDDDGDMVLRRRRDNNNSSSSSSAALAVMHRTVSDVAACGTQVWRASLLLTDHLLAHADRFSGAVGLELACGCGLPGIALARVARRVYLTDARLDALELASRAVALNACVIGGDGRKHARDVVRVRRFDLQADVAPWTLHGRTTCFGAWDADDARALAHSVDVVLIADALYDGPLTDRLVHWIPRLLPPGSRTVALVALERRLVFSAGTVSVCAPATDYFFSRLAELGATVRPLGAVATAEAAAATALPLAGLAARQMAVPAAPQCLSGAGAAWPAQLELWEIMRWK